MSLDQQPISFSPSSSFRKYRKDVIVLLVASVVLIALRLHALNLPLETDEANYAYIGGRLLVGDLLYEDVWDHQPPGIFVLCAAVISIFGDEPVVFRGLALTFSLLSLTFIYLLIRATANRWTACVGAILFALVSSDPGSAGEGCNREIYMNTLILAGWLLAQRYERRPRAIYPLGAGLLLGLASLIKTIVAVHWLLLAVWLMVISRSKVQPSEKRWGSMLRTLVLLGVGPSVLWGGSSLYFAFTDRWDSFVDAVFLFNLSYSSGGEPFFNRFVDFFDPPLHRFIFESALPLWCMGLIASLSLLVRLALGRGDRTDTLYLLLVLSGFLTACLPAQFWPHYYYLLWPGLVVVTARAMDWWSAPSSRLNQDQDSDKSQAISHAVAPLQSRLGLGEPSPATQTSSLRDGIKQVDRTRWVPLALGLLILAPLFYTQYQHYLRQPPFGITVKRYNSRDFWAKAQGENLRRVTEPDDAVFVFGNDAAIYYYAKRRCASRYTMITGLQPGMANVAKRRELFLEDMRRVQPRVIVVLFDETPWDAWKDFLRKNYTEPVGWDYHDKTGEPIMFVVSRLDDPIEAINWDWDRSLVNGWFLQNNP